MKYWVIIVLAIAFHVNVNGSSINENGKIPALNTAINANYLSPLEKELIYEINLMRSNPTKYAKLYIAPLTQKFEGKLLYYPGDKPLKTKEGLRAVNECIQTLKRAPALPIMYPSSGLSQAANDHVKDQSKTGKTGHAGADRSNVRQRIERYGDWKIRIAENIAYGGISARQVVVYLLIDDGVSNRGHRKNFLHPDYKKVGVAYGKHPHYKNMCVMDFAGGFNEN